MPPMVIGVIAGLFLFFGLFFIAAALRTPPLPLRQPPRVPPAQLKVGASSPLHSRYDRTTYALSIIGLLVGLAFVGIGGSLLWLIYLYW